MIIRNWRHCHETAERILRCRPRCSCSSGRDKTGAADLDEDIFETLIYLETHHGKNPNVSIVVGDPESEARFHDPRLPCQAYDHFQQNHLPIGYRSWRSTSTRNVFIISC
ncbi:MAG: hypothetical protein MZU97_06575 [Bacillus subtilis]|nr:hypothetical protein [Bacillus subtilis]